MSVPTFLCWLHASNSCLTGSSRITERHWKQLQYTGKLQIKSHAIWIQTSLWFHKLMLHSVYMFLHYLPPALPCSSIAAPIFFCELKYLKFGTTAGDSSLINFSKFQACTLSYQLITFKKYLCLSELHHARKFFIEFHKPQILFQAFTLKATGLFEEVGFLS